MGRDLRKVRERVLTRNNAQAIREELEKLEEQRSRYRTRWLWELIQNARDAARVGSAMTIEIVLHDEMLTFRHNGRPFTEEEIVSVIDHGSTKPQARRETTEPLLGKYGTGFLATHLLSRTVEVVGSLGENGTALSGFQFLLDRTGRTDDEVWEASERSFVDFNASLESGACEATEWTEFRYRVGAELRDVVATLEYQLAAIPYILAFNDAIGLITIADPVQGRRTFQRSPAADSSRKESLAVIEIASDDTNEDAVHLAVFEDGHVRIAARVSVRSDTKPQIEDAGNIPQLFLFLPLVGTEKLGLPVVFHNARFIPTEERDGIHLSSEEVGSKSNTNRQALEACRSAAIQMAQECSDKGWSGLHRFIRIEPAGSAEALRGDTGWFNSLQQVFLESLASVPLLDTGGAEVKLRPLREAIVPVDDESLTAVELYKFAVPLFREVLVSEGISGECAEAAVSWEHLLGREHPLLKAVTVGPSRLIAEVRRQGNIDTLAERLACDADATIKWLDALMAAWPEERRLHDFDGVLPDQMGTFCPNSNLSRDEGLDDELKDILDDLGTSIRSRLLHRGILNAQNLLKSKDTNNDLVAKAKDLLKRQMMDETAISPEFRGATVSFFAWLADRDEWDHLRDNLPVLTLDREGRAVVSQTSAKEARLLWPRTLWPANAQPFWNAMPPESILADIYADLVPPSMWDRLESEGVVLARLLSEEAVKMTAEQIAHCAVEPDLETEHGPAEEPLLVTVGTLALVGTSAFSDALRHSRERAARFLRFILEYVVHADSSWKRREEIPCAACNRPHTIIPCSWLAWMRNTQWIPRGKDHADPISTESLARLTKGDPELAALVTNEGLQDFFDAVGVNVLEQALLGHDESQRAEFRRKLAQLTRSITSPNDIDALVNDMEVRRQAGNRWEANQAIGKRVEQLVRELLKQEPALNVSVRFVGYDLEAYVRSDVFDEDVGTLDVGPIKIEIKATRHDSVSMSGIQARTATDNPAQYWLCVVPLNPDDLTSEVDGDLVRARAHLVEHIGETLSKPRDDLNEAAAAARDEGIELEHVDAVRFRVTREVWESRGISIGKFIDKVLHRP